MIRYFCSMTKIKIAALLFFITAIAILVYSFCFSYFFPDTNLAATQKDCSYIYLMSDLYKTISCIWTVFAVFYYTMYKFKITDVRQNASILHYSLIQPFIVILLVIPIMEKLEQPMRNAGQHPDYTYFTVILSICGIGFFFGTLLFLGNFLKCIIKITMILFKGKK